MVPQECSVCKRQYKVYSREFKLDAIRLVDESGESAAQVSREPGEDHSDPEYPSQE